MVDHGISNMMVVDKVDIGRIWDHVEEKTQKKVELIVAKKQPKQDDSLVKKATARLSIPTKLMRRRANR